jgi:8-oxo-dGTP pyrophosphatase MutT (NUDIX family)
MQRGDGDQSNPWALIRREDKFDCRYYIARRDVVRLQGGEERLYTHIHMKQLGVAVVPIDDDGTTTLVGQYRYVLDRYTWEIPKGGGRRDLPSLDSAKRELSEETGFRADYWLQLFAASASPGLTDAAASGFVAWGLHGGDAHPDPEEIITPRRVPFSAAVSMVLSGEIADYGSMAAILTIETKLRRGELPSDLAALLLR